MLVKCFQNIRFEGVRKLRTIRFSQSFEDSREKLSKQSRKIVNNSIKQFAKDEKGINYKVHKLKNDDCDPTFRSARMNDDLRLIFSIQGSDYVLLYVDHHDAAYDWAKGKYLNSIISEAYIYDQSVVLEELEYQKESRKINQGSIIQKESLFDLSIRVKDLTKLGLNETYAEVLLNADDQDRFLDLVQILPVKLADLLIDLVSGDLNITQAYAKYLEIEESNKKTKDSRFSSDKFFTVSDEEDLDRILDSNFERWKLFLHPKQEFVVKRNFNGPALIEGGPGTGKSVVGLHRAVYLSKNVYPNKGGHRILIGTFSRKLAIYLDDKLRQLLHIQGVESNIDVQGIDSLILSLNKRYKVDSRHIDIKKHSNLFKDTYSRIQPPRSLKFCANEYQEVILRNNITTWEEYRDVLRVGQGEAVREKTRGKLWEFFNDFLVEKNRNQIAHFDDLAWSIFNALTNKTIPSLYDSVVVDEAQDLSPIKIKLLYGLCKDKYNSFMLLSDQNQRIFQLSNWKQDTNLQVVGRTHYLNINYRTSKQIKEYSERQFYNSEMDRKHLKGYRSIYEGPEPQIEIFEDSEEQYLWIHETISKWLSSGIEPYEIVILCYRNIYTVIEKMNMLDIDTRLLKKDSYPHIVENRVGVSTLEGCKGLEFRAVIIANYQDLHLDLESSDHEELAWIDFKKRQLECLKYVACTRAREFLAITMVDNS